MKNIFLILLLTLALVGCASDDNLENVDYEILEQGNLRQNINNGAQNIIINNQNDWKLIINELSADHYDLSLINIDFNTNLILYIRDKEQPSSGYYITIDNIYESSSTMNVYIKSRFENEAIVQPTPSQPFCLVLIPKTNKSINFINR